MDLERDVQLSVVLPADRQCAARAAALVGLVDGAAAAPCRSAAPAASFDRDFAFVGERATLFLLVTPVLERGDRSSVVGGEEFAQMCRGLEVLLSTSADTCRVGSAQLCPVQPGGAPPQPAPRNQSGSEQAEPAATADAKDALAEPHPNPATPPHPQQDAVAALEQEFRAAAAVYYFNMDMIATAGDTKGSVELELYCRLKSISAKTLVSRVGAGLNRNHRQRYDPFSFRSVLPQAQDILSHDEISTAMSSQTRQVRKELSRVRCLSVTSRSRQVNGKCFVEVCCENVHDSLDILLKDLTFVTFSSQAITMSVSRVGRWVLPLKLRPQDRQSVCFMLSGFADVSGRKHDLSHAGKSQDIGDYYTCVATVTWTSELALSDVRMEHRVEWGVRSGVFDPIGLQLSVRSGKGVHVGETFKAALLVTNRSTVGMNLHVLLPTSADSDGQPVLPLDATVKVGKLEPGSSPESIELEFVALQTSIVDLAKLVQVYDTVSKQVHQVKEPCVVNIQGF